MQKSDTVLQLEERYYRVAAEPGQDVRYYHAQGAVLQRRARM